MLIRFLNLVCLVLAVTAIVADYRIAERTRVARVELTRVEQNIGDEQSKMGELQAEYVELSRPDRIQTLAESMLGMSDRATAQLASLQMLPRDDGEAGVGGEGVPTAPGVVSIAAQTGQ